MSKLKLLSINFKKYLYVNVSAKVEHRRRTPQVLIVEESIGTGNKMETGSTFHIIIRRWNVTHLLDTDSFLKQPLLDVNHLSCRHCCTLLRKATVEMLKSKRS